MKALWALASKLLGSTKPEAPRRTPRASRITVEGLQFLWLDVAEQKFQVLNISASGVGFFSDQRDFMSEPQKRHSAWLFLSGQRHEVALEVVRQARGVVGARWVYLSEDFKQQLWKVLEPERVAAEALRMNDSLLEQQPDGKPILYTSKTGCEIYLVTSYERGLRGHCDWFGSHVEFATGRPLFVQIAGRKLGEARDPSEQLYDFVVVDATSPEHAELVDQVARFVRALPGLEQKLKEQVVELLQSC